MSSILLVPSVKKGNGSGHLSRCFDLARRLGARAAIFLPERPVSGDRGAAEIGLAYHYDLGTLRIVTEVAGERFGLIILDKRESTAEDYRSWANYGTVVALDEGGQARVCADYLIDILPRTTRMSYGNRIAAQAGNIASLGFLSLPARRRKPPTMARKVLVCFGGEDPAGLTERFLEIAVDHGRLPAHSVTVVSGALSATGAPRARPGLTMLGPVQDLKEKLADYDLVVTQFGLTAFEAAWAGCAVLLLNPSPTHEALSRKAGFISLGTRTPSASALTAALTDITGLAVSVGKAAPREAEDLAALLGAMVPRHAGACPVCGGRRGIAIHRSRCKTYKRCPDCGMVSMSYFIARKDPYSSKSYFFDEYKAQYGRTYLEDMPAIRRMAAGRLDSIEGLLPAGRAGASILDVGCAYGPFLAEAQAREWNPVGSDLSSDAVAYVRTQLKIPAFMADFSTPGSDGFYPRNLECLTMWFVIEHFDELGRVLRRARSLLKPGGVFAFSTPSCAGISARSRPAEFWERSPDDHFTVWDPRRVRGILKRYGFEVRILRVTGHHPERFPGVPANKASIRYRIAMILSRIMELGDTFECYATCSPDRETSKDRP
ncbi:MAG: methyltransferase domain-containing protein [Spirochaetales bacterium]|nr:MAG: methyltransferase domain-containing protein [Spirochaetales bacterium]